MLIPLLAFVILGSIDNKGSMDTSICSFKLFCGCIKNIDSNIIKF